MNSLFSLDNRIALITGGSEGIGSMIAEGLTEQGASRVYVCDKELPENAPENEKIIYIQSDITTEEGREKLFCEISALEPYVNILINSSLANTDDWEETVKYNMEAPVKLTQKFFPLLKASTNPEEGTSISTEQVLGKVINLTTVDGVNPPQVPYFAFSSTNAGMIHASKSFAVQYIRHKIVVSSITIGLFNTTPDQVTESNRLSVTQGIPAKRLGHKDDIVAAITYLASRAGDYCVGTHIVVDGGVAVLKG
jgi:NAD(P)-dependent dehydrogenase (short-subunit alcohol dehydrogenase family)